MGSSGLLGLHLTKFLSTTYKVEKFIHSHKNNFVKKKFVDNFFKHKNYDIIINLSALTDIDFCEKNKNKAYKVNFLITKNIVDTLLKFRKDSFYIFVSTDQFYNNFKKNNEKNASVRNYYTKTKYLAENYLTKIKSISLRTNFFGKSKNKTKRQSFTDSIYYNLKRNKEINLADDILFSPLSILSLNKIIKIICKKRIIGRYNIGSHGGLSKYEFGNIFAKRLNLKMDLINKVSYKDISFFAKRNKDMRMVLKKFEKKFNKKLPNLHSEINQTINEYKKV